MKKHIWMLLVLCGALLAPKALGATYTITVNQQPHGTITPGTCTVVAGSSKTFTFTPDPGYILNYIEIVDMWPGGFVTGTTTDGNVVTYTFTNIQANHGIQPQFLQAPTIDSYTPDSPVSIALGSEVDFAVYAHWLTPGDDATYLVYQWYLDGTARGGATASEFIFHPLSGDLGTHTLSCRIKLSGTAGGYVAQSWTVTVYDSAATYTITASAGAHGAIAPSGAQTVAALGTQAFTITPEAGYVINDVQVDGGYDYTGKGVTFDTANGFQVTCTFSNVLANHTLQVSFRQAVVLTSTPASPAYVPAGSSQAFHVDAVEPLGDPVEYQWYLDSTSLPGATASTWTYSPTLADVGTHEVKTRVRYSGGETFRGHSRAVWTVIVYDPAAIHTITASAGLGGSISPSGAVAVSAGTNRTFAIQADSGYKISSVTVDGTSVGAQSSYTFSNVTADHTIAATFTKKSSGGGGGGGGGCSIASNSGKSADLLGWLLPYAAILGIWLASRRKAARA